VEKQLHDAFLDHRVRSSREFFELSPDRVVSALKLAEIENVTPKKDYVELKAIMMVFTNVIDERVKNLTVKNRMSYWQIQVKAILAMMFNADIRKRVLSKGGPYNETLLDMQRSKVCLTLRLAG